MQPIHKHQKQSMMMMMILRRIIKTSKTAHTRRYTHTRDTLVNNAKMYERNTTKHKKPKTTTTTSRNTKSKDSRQKKRAKLYLQMPTTIHTTSSDYEKRRRKKIIKGLSKKFYILRLVWGYKDEKTSTSSSCSSQLP